MGELLVEREKVTDEVEYVVALAASKGEKGGASKPFEILRVGNFKRGSRAVPVTSEDLDEAVDNFNRWKAMGQDIPVDYDHAFSEGKEAPAAGWYESLTRKGDSLYATVKWTDKAREEIESGLYRFFSPEFHKAFVSEEGDPEGFTILAGALTNRPFLRGMTPVALSQEVAEVMDGWVSDRFSNLSPEQLEALADTPDVSIRKDKKTGDQAEKFTVEIDGEEQEFTAEEIVAMHSAKAEADDKVAAAEKAEKDAKAEAAAKETTIESLSTRVESMEKSSKDRDFAEIFKQAQNEGRVDAKDETEATWRETFDQLGAEKTKALLDQIPAETIPMSAQGRGTPAPDGAPIAPKGYDEDRYAMNQRVNEYMEEHPDADFEKALNIVRAEAAKQQAAR